MARPSRPSFGVLRVYTDGTPCNTHVFLPSGAELAIRRLETDVTAQSEEAVKLTVYVRPLTAAAAAKLIARNNGIKRRKLARLRKAQREHPTNRRKSNGRK